MASAETNRFRWRCRRGMRELDIVLNRFLDQDFEQLDPKQRAVFDALLDTPDPELYAWLLNRTEVPVPEFRALLSRLQAHGGL